ncbi:MAG: glucosidase [Bacteroidetes bacterium]|nr:MAG: glucosidase [Bacteroidota bacterium]
MNKKTTHAEQQRLQAHYAGQENWLKWGPYLSERQWGTVREDYSPNGDAWNYFPYEHARSRVYRWGEDGLAGICDEYCRLCFALALWNGRDSMLKERLFGLSGPQGNHGEDVKELYYYLDSTPTHSYMKQLYKYPQAAFPYEDLLLTNQRRSKEEGEYELLDTGVFDESRYFDVFTEYAKAGPEDLLIRFTIFNRGPEAASLSVLPTLWFRNLWSFGLMKEKPRLEWTGEQLLATHAELGQYVLYLQQPARLLFTENETNTARIFGFPNVQPFVKDAINDAVIRQDFGMFEGKTSGTRFSPLYEMVLEPGGQRELRLRLCKAPSLADPLGGGFEQIFARRQQEAEQFYQQLAPLAAGQELRNIQRQALAGMLWTKQYYHIDIPRWLNGDPGQPPPPESRRRGRNADWLTLNNEDIISMPDKWEYPWYAAWDLAFHCVPLAMVDVHFAKNQPLLFLREWYMKPNGQIPAYEWSFSDVNPPVHAWACLQVYKMDKAQSGKADTHFLKRCFHKLLINFTWWVNRKDVNDNNVFEGGFLGLDNIGVFDRSAEVPGGGLLEQADGTSWMAMYCLNMLEMSLELAAEDSAYEDLATKFFEHFVYIAASLNRIAHDWPGCWNEEEGFFYDFIALPDGSFQPIKVRSLVGLTSLFATLVIDQERLEKVPEFRRRLEWFRNYRMQNNFYVVIEELDQRKDILLSLTPRRRLEKMLTALLDEQEFFAPGGIRSLSKIHQTPYTIDILGQTYSLSYEPGESRTSMFGGNSNWRGPVWMPMNYLLIQSLQELHKYYGKELKLACPSGSSRVVDLRQVSLDIARRLISIFERDQQGRRPVHPEAIYQQDPHFRDLLLFYEYFHGDNSRGLGASHQTGWTGLVASLIQEVLEAKE